MSETSSKQRWHAFIAWVLCWLNSVLEKVHWQVLSVDNVNNNISLRIGQGWSEWFAILIAIIFMRAYYVESE